MTPFTDAEFAERWLAAMASVAAKPRAEYAVVIESGDEGLPRASSIGNCARQQGYRLTYTPETDPSHPSQSWSQWMGYAGQEFASTVLTEMGYAVERPGLLQSDYMTGHPDGVLTGLDFGSARVLWDAKVRNVWGFRDLLSKPLKVADQSIYLQLQFYMAQLGAVFGVVTIHPHDLSTWKTELRRSKQEIKDAITEPVVHRVFIEADPVAQEIAERRARDLLSAKALDLVPAREFNPLDPKDARFPCGWCSWRSRCLTDDINAVEGRVVEVTPIPLEWSW